VNPVILELRDLGVTVMQRSLLSNVNLSLAAGECVAVMGPSGVGKTSLLNCIAGIVTPASGSVLIDGLELNAMPSQRRSAFRLRRIGMVFQFAELLPELTVADNVALPPRLTGMPREAAQERALSLLGRFGLAERAGSHPHELSGGQQQLVGLARALVHEPVVVLADEPTGMLDQENTVRVADALISASREFGAATIVVTHDWMVASKADRTFSVAHGSLVAMSAEPAPAAEVPVVQPLP
jgi:putative ABC transport system ATP-binding protein